MGSAVHVKQLQDELWERNAELNRMSRTDSLTGLYNRWHLDDVIARDNSTVRRHGDQLSIVLMDIDHFKHVNDTYRHPAGELVLVEFARRMTDQLRAGDIAGRWGGEEFLIILPRTDIAGALLVAERVRVATAATPVIAATTSIPVTVSGGCATGSRESPGELLGLVDARIHRAEAAGRNRIVADVDVASSGTEIRRASR